MDTSETYIKMCDCPEIQGQRQVKMYDNTTHQTVQEGNYEVSDCFLADGEVYIYGDTIYPPQWYSFYDYDISLVGYDEGDGFHTKVPPIWLPRQDQLQEMVDDARGIFDNYGYGNNEYSEFMELSVGDYWDTFTSMEQLWLAFVMKEKFGKTWDGEKWIAG